MLICWDDSTGWMFKTNIVFGGAILWLLCHILCHVGSLMKTKNRHLWIRHILHYIPQQTSSPSWSITIIITIILANTSSQLHGNSNVGNVAFFSHTTVRNNSHLLWAQNRITELMMKCYFVLELQCLSLACKAPFWKLHDFLNNSNDLHVFWTGKWKISSFRCV